MFVIWRGYGILVGLVGFLGFFFADLFTTRITGETTYYSTHIFPKICGAISSFGLTFGVVFLLAKYKKPRVLIDKASGQEVHYSPIGSLFFIPARFLPYVFLGIGLIVAFIQQ
jgi:hypothetical protein